MNELEVKLNNYLSKHKEEQRQYLVSETQFKQGMVWLKMNYKMFSYEHNEESIMFFKMMFNDITNLQFQNMINTYINDYSDAPEGMNQLYKMAKNSKKEIVKGKFNILEQWQISEVINEQKEKFNRAKTSWQKAFDDGVYVQGKIIKKYDLSKTVRLEKESNALSSEEMKKLLGGK